MKLRKAELSHYVLNIPSIKKVSGKKQTQMYLGFEKERLRHELKEQNDTLLAATLVSTKQKYSKHMDKNYGEGCQSSEAALNLWLQEHSVIPKTVVCKIPCTGFGWIRDLTKAREDRIRANKCSYLQHKKQRENSNPCEKELTRKFKNSGLAEETRASVHLQAMEFYNIFRGDVARNKQLPQIDIEEPSSELQCQGKETITPQPDTLARDAASHLGAVVKEVEDRFVVLDKSVHPETGNTYSTILNLRTAHVMYVENYINSGQVRYGLQKSSPLPDALPVKTLSDEVRRFRDHSPTVKSVEESINFIRSLKGDPSKPDPTRLGLILKYQDIMGRAVTKKGSTSLKKRVAHHLVRLQSLRKPPCMDPKEIQKTKMQLRQEMIRNPAYDRVMKSKEVENDAVRYQYFSGKSYVEGYRIPKAIKKFGRIYSRMLENKLRPDRDQLSGGASYTWESKKPFDTRSEKSANDANNMFVGPLPKDTDTRLILPEGVIDLSAVRSRKVIVNSKGLLVPKTYNGENLYKADGDLNLEAFTELDKDMHGIKDDE